jgi:predicted phage baseplate assembly protein
MSCSGASTGICPCGTLLHPQVIFNPPGLSAIAYRVGEYPGFRAALLQALPGETELTQTIDGQAVQVWRPGAEGDLAVQMIEWWAYLSDVLTFYNERIAAQAYLRTADLPESVGRLIQVLGYRPRPALGARGTLAAMLSGSKPVLLPKGLQIQSKPGPGKQPQVFELDADTRATSLDEVRARTVPTNAPLLPPSGANSVWLAGKVSGIKPGDKLLLAPAGVLQGQVPGDFAWISVTATAAGSDPAGNPVTVVSFAVAGGSIAAGAQAANYVLLRSAQNAPPWPYPAATAQAITQSTLELATLARGMAPGQLLLLEVTGTPSDASVVTTPVIVQSYVEVVWYANGDGPTQPVESPPGSTPAIAIPHAEIGFTPQLASSNWNANRKLVTARWDFSSVGQLVPVLSAADLAYTGTTITLAPLSGAFALGESNVLVQDANGNGASGTASSTDGQSATLANLSALPTGGLAPPIDVLFDLLSVSRGKTVASEILGSGNAAIAGQDFVLKQSPVTYQQDPASISGDNFSSTVRVWVNQVQWSEVRSFFGHDKNAQVFLLREDEQGKTHVVFGDGVNGARLPTGTNNVVANYRYGAGADAPAPDTLTVLLSPQPGLKSVRNPLAPTGGADADSPGRIRTLAPRSVMTFSRAVSLADYEAIAASAPGVVQAKAAYVFDPAAQRPIVTLAVAGDAGAVGAVKAALAGAADPNRPVRIKAATAVVATISLTYARDPKRDDATVRAGLHTALLDPDSGLFGANAVRIGQVFYDSQIYAACCAVPGVATVHSLSFTTGPRFAPLHLSLSRRVSFLPRSALAQPSCGEHRRDPGVGNYYSVPDDGNHLLLSGAVAS